MGSMRLNGGIAISTHAELQESVDDLILKEPTDLALANGEDQMVDIG
jgi:hypothetical protein